MAAENAARMETFFQRQALFGKYWGPLTIVLITSLLWALQPIGIHYALDSELAGDLNNALTIDTIVHFIIPFALWVFFWFSFIVLVHYLGGRVRPGRLFRMTAWGLAPFAIVAGIRTIGNYYVYQAQSPPIAFTPGRFPSEWRGYTAMQAETLGDPTLVGATVGGFIFLIASVYIWFKVIQYSTTLDDAKQIAIVVTVPIIVYVIYSLIRVMVY